MNNEEKLDLTEFTDVYKCLSYFQSQLKVGKNEENNFGGYKYRNIAQINDALKPLIEKTGAVVLNYVSWEERFGQPVCVGVVDFRYKNDSIQIEHMVFHATQRPKMDPSQNSGATATYAMRYALQDLFLLGDDSIDPDKINDGKTQYEPTTIKKNIVVWNGVEYDYNDNTEREILRALVKKYIYTHTKAENATIYLALKDVNSPLLNKEFIDWVKDSDLKFKNDTNNTDTTNTDTNDTDTNI